MKCMSIEAMNLFLLITGLDIQPYDVNTYVVTSNQPAYYTFLDGEFCLTEKENDPQD